MRCSAVPGIFIAGWSSPGVPALMRTSKQTKRFAFPAAAFLTSCYVCWTLLMVSPTDKHRLASYEDTKTWNSWTYWAYPLCETHLSSPELPKSPCSWTSINQNFKQMIDILSNKKIALVGDSRIRHVYSYIKSMLDGRRFLIKDTFNDTTFHDPARNISLMFFARWFPDDYLHKLLRKWEKTNENVPQYIVFESGAWSLFRYGERSLDSFVRNLSRTADYMAKLRHRTTVIWMKTLPFHPTAASHQGHWITDGNSSTLDRFGREFEKVAVVKRMVSWTSAFDDAKNNLDRYADHVHPGAALIRKSVCQLLQALSPDSCNTLARTGGKQE